ncbi:MAG: transketolase [Deltaproteobacteria bacterium]|nr:transketolase [Deltaproteobacteria bacterium]
MGPPRPERAVTDLSWVADVEFAAAHIRRRVLAHTLAHGGGYMSQACSAAELLATLYLHVLQLPPVGLPILPQPFAGVPGRGNRAYRTGAYFNGTPGPQHDRFFLSPAHYALVVYATLVECGRMDPAGLEQFNLDGSSVEMIGAEHSPGMEVMAGSLGQAVSVAAGVAMARRRRGDRGRAVVMLSDGEFQIGQTWEALQAMAFHRLDNMLVYADCNGQQCDGAIDRVMRIEPLRARLEAFGCRVAQVDAHDAKALAAPATWRPDGRPLVVLAQSDPCRGLEPLRANAPKLHYLRLQSDAERARYRAALEAMRHGEGP